MPIGDRELTARIRAPFLSLLGQLRARFQRDGWENDYQQRAFNAAGTDQLDLIGTDALNNTLLAGQVTIPFETPIRCQISAAGKIGQTTPFFCNANDTTPLEITRIDCIFGTADGAVNTGFVSKDGQGIAAGKGSSCMTGTFDMNATANTLQVATLAGARGTPSLVIGPGEQLTFNIASTLTSLASLYVTVWVRPATGCSIAQYYRPANADIATYTAFLNLVPGLTVRAIAIRSGTIATDAGTITVTVTKDTGTTVPGAGTALLAASQSLKAAGSANTTLFPALTATAASLVMAAGDRIAVKLSAAPTTTANFVVTIFFSSGPEQHVLIPVPLWDNISTDRTMFVSDAYYQVIDCWETFSTVSTSLTHLLTKDTGTTAPGGGTGLQTDNTNTGILTSSTINTPVGSVLLTAVSTKPTLWLAPGDRLGYKNAGTAGSPAGNFAAILLREV